MSDLCDLSDFELEAKRNTLIDCAEVVENVIEDLILVKLCYHAQQNNEAVEQIADLITERQDELDALNDEIQAIDDELNNRFVNNAP
jgi:hypothetical protein